MTRNMIDANEQLFGVLLSKASETGRQITAGKRWLATSDSDKHWLQDLKLIESVEFVPNKKAALCSLDSNKYFVVVGIEFTSGVTLPPFLTEESLNAGAFGAIAQALDVQLHENALAEEIYNTISDNCTSAANTEYAGEDYRKIVGFFKNINIFLIGPEIPFKEDLFRLIGIYLCVGHQNTLPFSPDAIESFQQLFIEGHESIPFESIQMSLCSTQYKHAFLEIYRSIERQIPLEYANALKAKLNFSGTNLELHDHIESVLSWYPNYASGLEKQFDAMSGRLSTRLDNLRKKHCGAEEMKNNKWIYKIRNSNVHLSPSHAAISLSMVDWNELISILLLFVKNMYQ